MENVPTNMAFDKADASMKLFIDYIDKFNETEFIDLLRTINHNGQIYCSFRVSWDAELSSIKGHISSSGFILPEDLLYYQ